MAYLDKNTFEVVDNIIEIDDRMVPIIQELNKKGYKTTYCCSGHEDITRIDYTPYFIYPEDHLSTNNYINLGMYEDYKVITDFIKCVDIYISFAENYEFDYIPEGFVIEQAINQTNNEVTNYVLISKTFSRYKDEENIILETKENLKKEIDISNQKLLEWARSLPSRKDVMKLKKVNE